MPNEAWQQVQADYCTSFPSKYYALAVIVFCPKRPGVLRPVSYRIIRYSSKEEDVWQGSVPPVLVTDNETHFTTKVLALP